MMRRAQSPDVSITSVYVAVALLGALLVAAAHPVGAAFGLLAVSALGLSSRALWRQATTHGISLPGTGGKLHVETKTTASGREQWTMTVSITER